MVNSKISISLLDREESQGLKGLLVLLVVLGHNSLLMEFTGLYSFLYSFHVYAFYILPFIYGVSYPKDSEKNIIKLILKRGLSNFKYYYMLLIIWSSISLIIIMARGTPFPGVMALLEGYILNTSLRETFGGGFLCFMPTMVSVLFWRDIYFVLNKKGYFVVFGGDSLGTFIRNYHRLPTFGAYFTILHYLWNLFRRSGYSNSMATHSADTVFMV